MMRTFQKGWRTCSEGRVGCDIWSKGSSNARSSGATIKSWMSDNPKVRHSDAIQAARYSGMFNVEATRRRRSGSASWRAAIALETESGAAKICQEACDAGENCPSLGVRCCLSENVQVDMLCKPIGKQGRVPHALV